MSSERGAIAANERSVTKVIVIGAGLVGSLAAIYMARLGYTVEVFEKRADMRRELVNVQGRSINLALSARGIEALKAVGLAARVLETAIPMKARMVHGTGSDRGSRAIPYGDFGEAINSVGRRGLNELLLNAAEAEDRVALHFEHELQTMNAEGGEVTFRNDRNRKQVIRKADFILGCDGAYSVVRRELMKISRLDFSQSYIQHGYKEFCIPADSEGQWKLPKNYLHIWPRQDFMLIALPNTEGTFTATLFYPHEAFDAIKSDEDVLQLFREQFSEALDVIGGENVVQDYRDNPTGSLVTVRCSKYHHKDKVLLLGDAAHAMVPFYGQGMNAGFEDLLVLDKLLKTCQSRAEAFLEYSRIRKSDAHAICDLALYNYWEMSTGVNSVYFRMKRTVAGLIHKIAPRIFVPLYTMVAFSTIPYAEVVRRNRQQDRLMATFAGGVGLSLAGVLGYLLLSLIKRQSH